MLKWLVYLILGLFNFVEHGFVDHLDCESVHFSACSNAFNDSFMPLSVRNTRHHPPLTAVHVEQAVSLPNGPSWLPSPRSVSPAAPTQPDQEQSLLQAHVQLSCAHSKHRSPANHIQCLLAVFAVHLRHCSVSRYALVEHTGAPSGQNGQSKQQQQAVGPAGTDHKGAEQHESSRHTPAALSPGRGSN